MVHIFACLLTLFFSLSSPALEGNAAFRQSSLAAKNTSGPRYGGQFYDASTDQVYLRNRYYSPGTGRFNTMDPIGYQGGHNLYGYCGGDPVNYRDPMGTEVELAGELYTQIEFYDLILNGIAKAMINSPHRYTFASAKEMRAILANHQNKLYLAKDSGYLDAPKEPLIYFDTNVVKEAASNQIADMREGIRVITDGDAGVAYDEIIDQQAAAAAKVWSEDGGITATSYVLGNFTGATPLLEGAYGNDLSSKRELDNVERWSRGLQGGGGLVLSATGTSGTVNSFRAGYTGTGFSQAYRWASTYKGLGVGPPKPGVLFGQKRVGPRVEAAKGPLAQLQGTVDDLADRHLLPQFRALDPNLKAGYTGSFNTGTVGNPNKATFGQPIDLKKFDIDYWIESDALFQRFGPNLKANPEFRKILSETPGFEGLKSNKDGFSIKFKPSGG